MFLIYKLTQRTAHVGNVIKIFLRTFLMFNRTIPVSQSKQRFQPDLKNGGRGWMVHGIPSKTPLI